MTKTLAAAALAAGLLAGGAQAATVEQTRTFTDITSTSLVFDAFDTALGTFTGATLSVSGTADLASGTVTGRTENLGAEDDNGFSAAIDLIISLGGVLAPTEIFAFDIAFCSRSVEGETCEATYHSERSNFSRSGNFDENSVFPGPSPSIDISAITDVSVLDGSLVSGPTTFWTATGTASLTYTYDPVTQPDVGVIPLPASLSLSLGGLALLGGLGYRRRSRA